MLAAILVVLLVFAGGSPALAAKIQNLSQENQTIEIRTSQGYQPVVLPPGRIYEALGYIRARFAGREVIIETGEEYVIWNKTDFGPQRRLRSGGHLQ